MGTSEQTWERRAGAAGFVFVLLFIAAAVVVPSAPSSGDEAEKIRRHFVEHGDTIRGSSYSFVLAGVFYLLFLAGLRSRIAGTGARVLANTAFGAGLVLSGFAGVATIVNLGLAGQAEELSADSVHAAYGIVSYYTPVATGVTFTLAAAVAIAAFGHGAFSRRLGYASLAYAGYEVIESFTVYGTSGAFEPGGVINGIGVVLFLPWALVISAELLRPAAADG
jgi:hypothetical protein